MNKKTVISRVLACLGVLCVLAVSVVPASADTGGWTVYPIIPIDEVAIFDPNDEPHNWFAVGLDCFVEGDGWGNTWYSPEDTGVGLNYVRLFSEVIYTLGWEQGLQIESSNAAETHLALLSHDFVIKLSEIDERQQTYILTGQNADGDYRTTLPAIWTVDVVYGLVTTSGDEYNMTLYESSISWDGYAPDILVMLWNCLNADARASEYVYIKSFRLTVNGYDRLDPNFYEILLTGDGSYVLDGAIYRARAYDMKDYLDSLGLKKTIVAETPDADFTSWLTTAIGSVFKTEIWPGFSIDDLLYVVLAIALVVALTRLLK